MTEAERIAQIKSINTHGSQVAAEIKAAALTIPGKTAGQTALEILEAIGDDLELNSIIEFATKGINAGRSRK